MLISVVKLRGLVGNVDTNFSEKHYFNPEDGGSIFLRNVGICLQFHTELQLRTPTWTFLSLRESKVLKQEESLACSKSPRIPRPCIQGCKVIVFCSEEFLVPPPNPQAGGPPTDKIMILYMK
jgi:hypothetical protein